MDWVRWCAIRERQIPPDATVRDDPRLQSQIRAMLVWRSSARIWAELHEKAFRRIGFCPRIIALDNLKEGVLVPDIYDVLAFYELVAFPCKVEDPDRKGKVDSGGRPRKKKRR